MRGKYAVPAMVLGLLTMVTFNVPADGAPSLAALLRDAAIAIARETGDPAVPVDEAELARLEILLRSVVLSGRPLQDARAEVRRAALLENRSPDPAKVLRSLARLERKRAVRYASLRPGTDDFLRGGASVVVGHGNRP